MGQTGVALTVEMRLPPNEGLTGERLRGLRPSALPAIFKWHRQAQIKSAAKNFHYCLYHCTEYGDASSLVPLRYEASFVPLHC